MSNERPLPADPPGWLVVVGSSAGGIEALGVLLGTVTPEFPAPIVIAQHLDPTRPSALAQVLERRTSARVVQVGPHTRLEKGTVYVVPQNRHVLITDGHVGLDDQHAERPRPSVDLLLTSAAEAYREHLVAVILTGSGHDGAAGAVDVKEAGGTVVIQNPATAAYPSMPQALPPTAVDYVVELEAITGVVEGVILGVGAVEPTDDEKGEVAAILSTVGRHASIDFSVYKPATLVRRIARRMAVRRVPSLPEYRDYLEEHPSEARELVTALLIKVTEFFRDKEAYDFLRDHVLPDLIDRGTKHGRVIRIWSAGCSTGEEAYSLAMLLADRLGAELPDWTVKIFATDVDDGAIAYARRGLYAESVLRNVSVDFRQRFFDAESSGFRVAKPLRQMVIFGQQDLARGVPFPRIDLVVCRNLLIYFKPELQATVLDLFAYSLHTTHGFLFLGKAETARPAKAVFELVNKKWKVHRCLSGPLGASPERQAATRGSTLIRAATAAGPEAPALLLEGAQLRRLHEQVLRAVPAGAIVIDRAYRMLVANAAARRLLAIRDVASEQDFLHTVRGLPYGDLRSAIDQTFREQQGAQLTELRLENSAVGEERYVTVVLAPLALEGDAADHVLVTIQDATEVVQAKRRLEALQTQQKDLTSELEASNQGLGEANKELQDANEELQAANEEMMLAQEELQATNEEFEATNEELQSTNEELETNNEELQATNEELETTNEELAARSAELQEVNRALLSERHRSQEIVEQAPFGMIAISGPAFIIETINEPATLIFGRAEPLVGRAFGDVCLAAGLPVLAAGAREAFRQDRPWHSEALEAGARLVRFIVTPSHDVTKRVQGLMVYMEPAGGVLPTESKA